MSYLNKLRETAEAATQGEWESNNGDGYTSFLVVTEEQYQVAACSQGAFEGSTDAEHIATFDPPTALLICDVLEAAEQHRHSYGGGELDDAFERLEQHLEGDER